MVLIHRSRRAVLAGFLVVVLACNPAAALRMLATERFVDLLRVQGEWVRAKLGLARRTPPLPIELAQSFVVRKFDLTPPETPFDREPATPREDAAARAARQAAAVEPRMPERVHEIAAYHQHRRAPPPDPSS